MNGWILDVVARTGTSATAANWGKRDDSSDPRIGSARDNATTTTLLRVPGGTNSPSGMGLLMTLLPVFIFAVVCFAIFLVLRKRYPRVYAPRTFLQNLPPHERSEALPNGWFNWILPFWRIPDKEVLDRCSLDAFLFLRYIKILCVICLVGCCITWPVLFPIHITGGGTNVQLDLLNLGNVILPSKYWAHAILAWIYFAFILYMVSRECIYYIHLRQAYLLSPLYAERLSSKTVLFTCVPLQDLDTHKIKKLFGDSVKNVWIPSNTEDIERLVKEKDETANRLQRAEVTLLKRANAAKIRLSHRGRENLDLEIGHESSDSTEKKSSAVETSITEAGQSLSSSRSNTESIVASPSSPRVLMDSSTTMTGLSQGLQASYDYEPPMDINGSFAAQWIPHESRPYHRPLANYGRRVDSIKWTRSRIKDLSSRIEKLRRMHRAGKGHSLPAVFVEFISQADAQSAYQTLTHHRAFHMCPDVVGISPDEIVWTSLRMKWWERIVRRFGIQAFIALMVIFWALPAAAVGAISNIALLSKKVPFLSWIMLLPSSLLGIIQGLLPSVALSLLMMAVPGIMRVCARQAGVPTLSQIELYTQNAYFVFQVVQVFLVTTLTSAASAAISSILENPSSAADFLSSNIPKASNFYISYFILQGLAMSGSGLVHLFSLVRDQWCLYSGGNPRLITRKWFRLRRLHWGAIYPVFTNMGVIGAYRLLCAWGSLLMLSAITYSFIAPLILGFAVLGLYPVYLTYKYNLLYVYGSPTTSHSTHAFEPVCTPSKWRTRTFVSPDAQGLHYPRALKQTLAGVYLAEICMFGLFLLQFAFGPVILMIALIIFTALVHISLNAALGPLMHCLPRTLALAEAAKRRGDDIAAPTNPPTTANLDFGDNPAYFDGESASLHASDPITSADFGDNPTYFNEEDLPNVHGESNPRPPVRVEEADGSRAIEGLPAAADMLTTSFGDYYRGKLQSWTADIRPHIDRINFWTAWISPVRQEGKAPGFVLRWLHPEVFEDYEVLRAGVVDIIASQKSNEASRSLDTDSTTLPTSLEGANTRDAALPAQESAISIPMDSTLVRTPSTTRHRKVKLLKQIQSFEPPCITHSNPSIWIPKDGAGIARQELRHCEQVGGLQVFGEAAWLDDKGRIGIDFEEVCREIFGREGNTDGTVKL